MRLRSVFLAGCVTLALPGLVASGLQAVQAWTAWQNAQAAARGAQVAGDLMHASTLLMATRGYLQETMLAAAPVEALARVADAGDAVLAQIHDALIKEKLPTDAVEQAREGLAVARRRALEAAQRHVVLRSPVEAMNRLVEGLDQEALRAERRITLASPFVGMVVGLARSAHELRATAGRRSVLLNSWFGGQDLAPVQRDELLVLTGRLAGAWDRLQRGVRAANPTPPVTEAVAFTDDRFFGQLEPWYRELVKTAAAGADRPMSLAQYRRWTVAALADLLPVRDALMSEAVAQGKAAVRAARRDLLVASGAALTSLGLMIAAMLALLRGLVDPVRRMTAALTALAAGDLTAATPPPSRLREVGAMAKAILVFRDNVVSLHQRETELQQTNLQFAAALENMSQGLAMYDAGERLTVFNRRFCEITRIPFARVQPGMMYQDILKLGVTAGHFPGKTAEQVYAERRSHVARLEGGTYHDQLAGERAVEVRYEPMAGGGWVSTFDDVTERRTAEARIVHMAHHDALTGLPNRVMLRERLEQALAQARRGESFAVLCLDLDHFKAVNDTLGHPVGDELLRAVTTRLRSCVRETDTIVRLGGDEFAVVQASLEGPGDTAALANRLVECLGEPYTVTGHQVIVGASIGVAIAPTDGDTPDELLKNADLALYRTKANGRSGWHFFAPEMDAHMQARRLLELDLRRAVVEEEFVLHYQPLVDLETRCPVGFEALLRWHHPERGLVSPAEFVPLAEEIGLIVPIGEWVLRQACREAVHWTGWPKVAVNLSASQFRSGPSLVRAVASALAASGLSPARLELEITETVILQDTGETVATLHRLKDLGVSISMDDFGTGYSSLGYLRCFPFDKVKIDQSFVRGLGRRGDSCGAIVRAVAGLCADLGMAVTAEGVETEDQLDHLAAEGINELQGYLFSRPVPAVQVPHLLRGAMLSGRIATASAALPA